MRGENTPEIETKLEGRLFVKLGKYVLCEYLEISSEVFVKNVKFYAKGLKEGGFITLETVMPNWVKVETAETNCALT